MGRPVVPDVYITVASRSEAMERTTSSMTPGCSDRQSSPRRTRSSHDSTQSSSPLSPSRRITASTSGMSDLIAESFSSCSWFSTTTNRLCESVMMKRHSSAVFAG